MKRLLMCIYVQLLNKEVSIIRGNRVKYDDERKKKGKEKKKKTWYPMTSNGIPSYFFVDSFTENYITKLR